MLPTPFSLPHCIELLSVVKRKAPPLGFLLFQSNNMDSLFTRQTLLMPFVYIMVEFHLMYLPTVFVAKPFLFLVILAALMVLFPSFTINC